MFYIKTCDPRSLLNLGLLNNLQPFTAIPHSPLAIPSLSPPPPGKSRIVYSVFLSTSIHLRNGSVDQHSLKMFNSSQSSFYTRVTVQNPVLNSLFVSTLRIRPKILRYVTRSALSDSVVKFRVSQVYVTTGLIYRVPDNTTPLMFLNI